ncbi:hypothetical protein BCR34DRAFT_614874 [Clohesyomyces aquaticus]|uniref:Mss4-like protein n=1 Tax=Clohesyomyces aquaticus TaxID=1231657 RepID=A0A1Y1ZL63_9PLEO|nr:hypothetical protein BCR34DRAFT_614874 [Clohesyomyces aquaticus]
MKLLLVIASAVAALPAAAPAEANPVNSPGIGMTLMCEVCSVIFHACKNTPICQSALTTPSPIPAPTLVDARLEGTRIKGDQAPEIYLILERKARHIANPDVYDAMFGDPPWYYNTAAQAYVDSLPKGRELDSTTPLVKGVGDPVYLIDGGKKRWIVNPDVFNRYGFDWGKIVEIGKKVDEIPTGKDIR